MTLKLDGLWRLCSKYRASLGWTPRPFSVSACFTGRLWAGGQRRPVNIAETTIGLRVQDRVALYSRFQEHVDSRKIFTIKLPHWDSAGRLDVTAVTVSVANSGEAPPDLCFFSGPVFAKKSTLSRIGFQSAPTLPRFRQS